MIEPVEIMLERDHAFRKKPSGANGRRRVGCAVCNAPKYHLAHLGAPPSMNGGNHSMQPHAYQNLKHAWQDAFTTLLEASELPKGLDGLSVEGLVGFSTRTVRDGGNYRWMIEKALGDALVDGGWLEDDCFYPVARYEFGGLQAEHSPGRSWLRLMIFPRPALASDATSGYAGTLPN